MNLKLKEIFRGKVVNKAHTINTGVDEFPHFVLDYLIDNYCEEEIFDEDMDLESIFDTRPVFHQRDETIRGHVYCSFLALVLRKELDRRLEAAGHTFE